jgi:hypothetical protein
MDVNFQVKMSEYTQNAIYHDKLANTYYKDNIKK